MLYIIYYIKLSNILQYFIILKADAVSRRLLLNFAGLNPVNLGLIQHLRHALKTMPQPTSGNSQ